MAVATLVGVNRHRVVGWMATNTERGVEDMAKTGGRVVDAEMGARILLILMAVQAVNRGVIGIHNHHLHSSPGWSYRVDVPAGIMTGATPTKVGGQDICKGSNRVTVRARLAIGLTTIRQGVDLHGMVDSAACQTMVMAIKVGGMAGDTLSATCNSWGDQGTVPCRIVAGCTTLKCMDLSHANKGRCGG